jgi:WD40-like Beta Propeller Repeat
MSILPLTASAAQTGTGHLQLDVFAPGAVSVEGVSVYRGSFDPTGSAFYFFRRVADSGEDYRIFVSRFTDGHWTDAERVFPGEYSDLYPTVSPDGSRMVLSSYRPLPGQTERARNANLWYADKLGDGWGPLHYLEQASTPANYDAGPVYQPDGSVQFSSTLPDWRTRFHRITHWEGTAFGLPEPDPRFDGRWVLPDSSRYYLWNAVESPDTSYAIFVVSEVVGDRRQPSDLWIAFRTNEVWGRLRPLDDLNTSGTENYAVFSRDGASLLFVRDFATYYRVSARALEALR